jgi:5-methylcytosine-specific restriction endonuclease McrA
MEIKAGSLLALKISKGQIVLHDKRKAVRKERNRRRHLRKQLKKKQHNKDYYFLKNLPLVPNKSFASYIDYCKSKYFQRLKKEVLRLANGKCSHCKGEAHTAHHIKYRQQWTETKLKDCVAICNGCHSRVHSLEIEYKEMSL